MPSPFISVICFREESMIQLLHRPHAKKPESGLFSDSIETIQMIRAVPIGQNKHLIFFRKRRLNMDVLKSFLFPKIDF